MSCLHVFAFSQLKNTNIFKEFEAFKEVVPVGQAPISKRKKTPPSKGTSQKKVSILTS